MSDQTRDEERAARGVSWLIVPLAVFGALVALFGVALRSGDPSRLPSPFINKAAPAFAFTAIPGLEAGLGGALQVVNGFDAGSLAKGEVSVVNFFASWCEPCVDEHPQLSALSGRPGVRLVGVNTKDKPANVLQFLTRYGNPYSTLGADTAGRGAIEWGVYGTPETFIVDGRGVIRLKHVGPISPETLEREIWPAIERAKGG